MGEQRTTSRNRCLFQARIIFNDKNSTLDCVVRDISAAGARLVLPQPTPVPQEVQLFIPKREETREARVVWRRGPNLGVRFVQAGS